jgi:hypothetical protein
MLQDAIQVMGVQQLEEIFTLPTNEITLFIGHDGLGNKRHSIRKIRMEIMWGSLIEYFQVK